MKAKRARELVAIVHALDDARAALAAGRDAGVPVTLVSAPGAVAYLGVGYLSALFDLARADFRGVSAEAAIDCGDDPGAALGALRSGVSIVVLRGEKRARARVAAIARAMGGRLLLQPPTSRTGRRGGGAKKRVKKRR